MPENKTKPNNQSVEEFLSKIPDPAKRQDSLQLLEMMKEITGEPPVLWGDSIIGFGNVHYKYASGREGDWFITGFSPRKQNMTVYLTYGFDAENDRLKRLGKHTIGKGCLYFKHLSDVDISVLRELIAWKVGVS